MISEISEIIKSRALSKNKYDLTHIALARLVSTDGNRSYILPYIFESSTNSASVMNRFSKFKVCYQILHFCPLSFEENAIFLFTSSSKTPYCSAQFFAHSEMAILEVF